MTELHTREEWEVTGDPGHGYPPYRFVFGNPNEGNKDGTPQERARLFFRMTRESPNAWPESRLRKRTITETDWEEVS